MNADCKDTDFYLTQLMSDECACGSPKRPRHSFCYRCYRSLPRHMQHDLYQYIGDGYEEAYEAAVEWLEL